MAAFLTSAVKLHAVMRDPEPMASGDSVLKGFECLVLKFNNLSAIQTNQVIVVAPLPSRLVPGLSISESSLGGQTQPSEELEGTIDGDIANFGIGFCDLRIDLCKALVPGRIEKNSKDLFPLLCRLQPFAGNACSKEAVFHSRLPDFEIEFQFHITHFLVACQFLLCRTTEHRRQAPPALSLLAAQAPAQRGKGGIRIDRALILC